MSAVSVTIGADTSQFDAAVKGLPEKVNRASAGMARAGGGGGFRGIGMASMQFQDIAVQAQMGAKWSVIIAQQVPQLLSAFGPSGMIAGGVIAIGGALFTMRDAANKAFADMKQAAKDFNTELDKTLAVGSLTNVADAMGGISKQMRELNAAQSDLTGAAQGSSLLDIAKGGWMNIKAAIGAGPSVEDMQAEIDRQRFDLAQGQENTAKRLLQISRQETEVAMLKASGQKEAALQMERQIKHGQELARIQGFAISQDAKRKLIGEAGMRFAAESQQPGGGSMLSRTMDLFSSKFQATAGPVLQAVKQQLNEQAGRLSKNAGDLSRAAFSPLKGDMDVSYGRGSSINPLTSGASAQIQQMMKQSALLKQQADKIDRSNSLLGDIAASVKNFNPQLSYN
jgi:hypothetical protein